MLGGFLPANVTKTISPITLAEEQPPAPLLPLPLVHAGLVPPPEGSYLTYIATSVRENHAPNAIAATPPIALTKKTCPNVFAMSIVCCNMTTLNGILGIQLMKQIMEKTLKRAKTTAAE